MQVMLTYTPDYAALGAWLRQRTRLLVVCGPSADGLAVGRFLREAPVEKVYFRGFRPNPRVEEALDGVRLLDGCDGIVALGGGSALDTAKAICFYGRSLPICAIPTTAGTGSEATPFAVIYARGEKQSLDRPDLLPQAVLLDPTALETLPAYQRQATALDALCHGVESAWCVHATGQSRALALEAIRGVTAHWQGYLENTPAGNAGMLRAANLAGQAIAITKTTAGHALCYKLTTRYGLAHGHAAGLCVGALWPHMARTAGPELQGVFLDIARALGGATVEEGIARFQSRLRGLARPRLLGDLALLCAGVNPERLQNNPLPLDRGDFECIYRAIGAPEE